ncbi:hypothetical protein [Roseiterribacter gracilis]|uniref:Uncharacterized protein n=1 Tax=Roseiterribacter gracilis TaxID=2812848 RepID=A0A8S8X781_9PROT|nr:hypothetical protein TMPK1_12200 [Rhodospirillales bacterium TMPK1]
MSITGVQTTGPAPRDARQTPPTDAPDDTAKAQTNSAAQAEAAKPTKPLDQVADNLKNVVLQTQADASGASNESLTQLFRVLIDLLAEPSPGPKTKLDV